MLRRILGYAVLAVLVLLALKVAFALLGTLLGLAVFVMVLAAMGFVMYLMLRVLSPTTAARVRELMGGGPPKTA
jgi:hypothetical protein